MLLRPRIADRAQIYLMFYKPVEDDPLLNRLVSYIDGPFSHIELAFSERYGEEPWEREMWGSSVMQGETVFFRPKTYSRDGYVSVVLEVSFPQVMKLKSYCHAEAQRGRPFCTRSMYAAYLPFQVVHDSEGTFCSKHIASALQYAGVAEAAGLHPPLCTPTSLYRHFTRQAAQRPIVQAVPSRLPKDRTESSRRMIDMLIRDSR